MKKQFYCAMLMILVVLMFASAYEINISKTITVVVTEDQVGVGLDGTVTDWINTTEYTTHNFEKSWSEDRPEVVSFNLSEANLTIGMDEDTIKSMSNNITLYVSDKVKADFEDTKIDIINFIVDDIHQRCNYTAITETIGEYKQFKDDFNSCSSSKALCENNLGFTNSELTTVKKDSSTKNWLVAVCILIILFLISGARMPEKIKRFFWPPGPAEGQMR